MTQVGFPVTMALQLLANPMPSSGHHLKTQSCTHSILLYMQEKKMRSFSIVYSVLYTRKGLSFLVYGGLFVVNVCNKAYTTYFKSRKCLA